MMVCKWDELPTQMKTDEIKRCYDILAHKKGQLFLKRAFDIVVSFLMLLILSPVFLVLAVWIKLDSPGPVFYRQVRVTKYGKYFRIFKFRSMTVDADKGSLVTVQGDKRITKVGKVIRKLRLDEICQLLNVLSGDMTFVGTRPEVPKYVEKYTPEMMATLLIPAGITSMASIYYKDEDELLAGVDDVDKTYIEEVLPGKMKYNIKGMETFSFFGDIKIMFMTFFAVLGKNYSAETEVMPETEEVRG